MSKIIFEGDSITAYMPYIFKGIIGNDNDEVKYFGVEYLNLHSMLIDEEGLFNKKYSDDGIHPNELGYNVIASEINKKLKKGFSKKLIPDKK